MTHPNKHIREAVEYALSHGWRLQKPGKSAHVWGTLLCPRAARDGCVRRVQGTPRNPETHAAQIVRKVDRCPH